MRDEEYEFFSDCREKKSTAASAFKRRTHTGKGGRVRLPSDNLTKKELEKMNGETKSYRLNEPMSWQEFKAMPDDIKIMYIKLLRQKFNVPGRRISDMMQTDAGNFAREIRRLGLNEGNKAKGKKTNWDVDGWYAWCAGAPKDATDEITESEAEEILEILGEKVPEEPIPFTQKPIGEIAEEALANEVEEEQEVEKPMAIHHVCECQKERKRVIPDTGNMVFEGLAEDVLETVRMLLGGAKVHISVTWDVLDEV